MFQLSEIYQLFDYIGTAVFAISGALAAMRRKLDPVGVIIIGFVTAIGGGTVRDLLIGNHPVSWMGDIHYFYIISASSILTMFFRKKLKFLRHTLMTFDTIGLGVFSVIGTQAGIQAGMHPFICVLLGVITASFGGVIRDILVNEIPAILHKEVYAFAAFAAGVIVVMCEKLHIPNFYYYPLASSIAIAIRFLAIVNRWQFPRFYSSTG